ncbi:ferritin-like domain-containing protein [Myxococcota bacterium]|nr:ferritin-like domain-containing protein [Myxococcota bacterium]
MPPAPHADATALCRAILERGDLAAKLVPPFDAEGQPLPFGPSGPAILIDQPARDSGLRMRGGREKLPRPGELADPASRRLCLARFAHHELMAVEYFAWAFLRWPELPVPLRRGLLAAMADEQRHCRLYLARLEALGGRFDGDDHSDYFWRHAPAIAASPAGPAAFLAAMGLTLEQANLDFTLTYRDGFAAAGDAESAAICQAVHDDEIVHVALAASWIGRVAPTTGVPSQRPASDLDHYLAAVPFPLAANRAKGKRFEVAPRARAGLSAAFIEHVRAARSSQERGLAGPWILPNLGAEEGADWGAYPRLAQARVAARLFGLLLPSRARLAHPGPEGTWRSETVADSWPPDLGPPAAEAVEPWLDPSPDALAWLNTPTLADQLHARGPASQPLRLVGPGPDRLHALHDKRFTCESSRALGLAPAELDALILPLDPDSLADVDALVARLEAALARWPAWTGRRFTLKPRFGSSGRGRVGGEGHVDSPALRGSLARFARQGGALFEPWLERTIDLSVTLRVPDGGSAPEILASFEMITTRSGVYRGHAGEIDADGRIRSGDRDDARARDCARALVAHAAAAGLTGACGVDSFRYRAGDAGDEALRGAVELNARPTMGLVAWGLLRRAQSLVRRPGAGPASATRAFLFTQLAEDAEARRHAILARAGAGATSLELAPRRAADEPRPLLFFGPDRLALREAHRAVEGC